MKTICIAGLKGGIGKTTTTTTLAYLLQAEKEKRVLLIDADCQANATMTYNIEPSDDGIADIMSYALKGDTPEIKSHIVTTDYGGYCSIFHGVAGCKRTLTGGKGT